MPVLECNNDAWRYLGPVGLNFQACWVFKFRNINYILCFCYLKNLQLLFFVCRWRPTGASESHSSLTLVADHHCHCCSVGFVSNMTLTRARHSWGPVTHYHLQQGGTTTGDGRSELIVTQQSCQLREKCWMSGAH